MSTETTPSPNMPEKLAFTLPERIKSIFRRGEKAVMTRKFAEALGIGIVPGHELGSLYDGFQKRCQQLLTDPPPGYTRRENDNKVEVYNDKGVRVLTYDKDMDEKRYYTNNDGPIYQLSYEDPAGKYKWTAELDEKGVSDNSIVFLNFELTYKGKGGNVSRKLFLRQRAGSFAPSLIRKYREEEYPAFGSTVEEARARRGEYPAMGPEPEERQQRPTSAVTPTKDFELPT